MVATQNPVEYEGTYPLPEAQLDRFLFKLQVGYPTFEQEQEVLARHDRGLDPHDVAASGIRPVADAGRPGRGPGPDRAAAGRGRRCMAYIVSLVRATRESPSVTLGVSPRGATALLHAAKAWAWLAGRDFVTPDEVKAVVKPALRHRILLRPELELEGATADGVLDGILAAVPVPRVSRPVHRPCPSPPAAWPLVAARSAVDRRRWRSTASPGFLVVDGRAASSWRWSTGRWPPRPSAIGDRAGAARGRRARRRRRDRVGGHQPHRSAPSGSTFADELAPSLRRRRRAGRG